MTTKRLFYNLIIANLKRLKHYLAYIITAVLVLLAVCSAAGIIISERVYKEDSFSAVSIAYYLPDDTDKKYNVLALSMLEQMKSIEETVILTQVSDTDEGYRMLKDGEALFFIIVPGNFFSGIMDSTNPSLDIIVSGNDSAAAYITNELFMSYAAYLGIAQAGIYSALDTARGHELSKERVSDIQDRVNLVYLDRALDKDSYMTVADATDEGGLSLAEHYAASAVMLCLFFITFIIAPLIRNDAIGITTRLNAAKINGFHIFISNFISTVCALYIAYIPCMLAVSVIHSSFNISGLVYIIPAILIISFIINLVNILCKSAVVNHMTILLVSLTLSYIGGGIMPSAMLPKFIQSISAYFPGKYLISCVGYSLWGL